MLHELIVEGKIVNPGRIEDAQIAIDGGYITELKKHGLRGEREIEALRCLIFPGFIDLHAHLREDSSHRWDYKEDFKSGTEAVLHGGITTVVDMPNTPLPGINSDRIRRKKELSRKKSKDLIDLLFCGGVAESNLSRLGEMKDDVVAYKIYLADSGGLGELYISEETLPVAIKAIEAASKPAIIHCEDERIIEKRREELSVMRGERKSLEIHSALRPDEAELSAVRNVLSIATGLDLGTEINIAHVSVYNTLRIINRYKNIHCEVTPHHLFFTRDDVLAKKAFLKINPPLRREEDRQHLLAALKEGRIDFLTSDHAPHTKEEKACDILEAPAGVPNLDTYGNFVSWLIASNDVHPTLIAKVCSYNPALFLGLHDRGRIEVGMRADLTILDMQKRVKISSEGVYTKCGWSPFEGYEFPGAVRHTIRNGIVATNYDEVTSLRPY